MRKAICAGLLLFGLTACQNYNPMDDYDLKTPTNYHDVTTVESRYPDSVVQHGKYLTELLACGTCHTDGAIVGELNPDRLMAGSRIGIAFSNPFAIRHPGVLYPANITPDAETGIGGWSDEEIFSFLRTGVDAEGRRHLPVMPWPAYARIKDEDARAIVAFLRSLEPVKHKVPDNVSPGEKARAPFVHFGVYQSRR